MASKIELGELYWKITAENTDLKRKLKDSESGAKKTGGALKGLGSAAVLAGFTAAAIGIAKVSKVLINAASDAQEVQNKFDVVFDGLDKTASDTAESLAQNYGLARVEAKNLLANTADLLNGFGLAKDSSLDLSNGVQQLAVDLASFQNLQGGAARASEILTKGLLGETEGLKQLGIAINQTELKNYAEENGLVFESLDKATKAQLTFELALKQSGNALGDYERSSDSFANVQRQIGALFDDIKVTLGQQLLPIISEIGVKIRDLLKRFADGIQPLGEFRDAVRLVGAIIGKLANMFIDQYIGYFNLFKDAITDLTGSFTGNDGISFVMGAFEIALNTVGAGLAVMMGIVDLNIKVYAGLIKTLIRVAKVAIATGKAMGAAFQLAKREISFSEFKKSFEAVGDSVKDVGIGIKDDFMDVINVFPETGKKIIAAYSDTLVEGEEITKEKVDKINKELGKIGDVPKAGGDSTKGNITEPTGMEKFEAFSNQIIETAQAVSEAVNSIYDAQIERITSRYDKELELIDRNSEAQKQAIMANGLSAEEQAAQIDIINETSASNKSAIEKKAAKEKAELEYKGAMTSWGVNLAMAAATAPMAILNAFTAGIKFGPITAGIFTGLASATSLLQIAAITASKPQRPSFAVGTTDVPHDMVANIHKDEMIVPATFADGIRKGEVSLGAGGGGGHSPVYLDGDLVGKWIYNAQKDGRLNTAQVSIV